SPVMVYLTLRSPSGMTWAGRSGGGRPAASRGPWQAGQPGWVDSVRAGAMSLGSGRSGLTPPVAGGEWARRPALGPRAGPPARGGGVAGEEVGHGRAGLDRLRVGEEPAQVADPHPAADLVEDGGQPAGQGGVGRLMAADTAQLVEQQPAAAGVGLAGVEALEP